MSHNIKEIPFQPSTIETIDLAMFNWLNNKMNIHATTNKGWKKVEVVWVSEERSSQIKKKREVRDEEGMLILPRISYERTGFTKDPAFKGGVQAHIERKGDYKGGTLPAARVFNQDKSSNFANAQSYRKNNGGVGKGQLNFKSKKKKPPVLITYTTPLPTWVKAMYKVSLRAEFQQQYNDMLQPFLVESGNITCFHIAHENHRYEAFFESDFTQNNNTSDLGEEERKFEVEFNIKVLGYLVGGGKNDKWPKFTKRENAVEFKFSREKVITGDEIEHTDVIKKYRP